MNTKNNLAATIKTIALSGVVAGTLDITGAIAYYAVLMDKTTAIRILQSIASGVFGKEAYSGGMETASLGLVFHYCIALSWATIYFLIYLKVPFLQKQKFLSGVLYGIVVWLLMNLVVLPLSNVVHGQFTLQGVLTGVAMLIFFIGLPISLMTHRYYSSKTTL